MRNLIGLTALAPCLALALSACSSNAPDDAGTAPEATGSATAEAVDTTLTLNGLGMVTIGEPVPVDSSFALRGAQASETCLVYTSPDYDGVYAIVEDGAVRRITVGEGSEGEGPGVTFVEGVGVGSTRADVDAAFPGFREAPAKYVEGGKDLIAPGADSGDPAVRLEMSPEGSVSVMHVGTMPVLGYVEGCG
ncbi:hypothetical protein [Croceicoccus gelatinilyticus]|uniref:hypothetical protein n=1 Tax=Croceicoccus gelatinilyticus TaxID=2835536 RepID=UPI001BCB45B9|nr:hypothetical protein [Croceicoccus gelatinilyticus]MBS7668526.1 hypothetical protein [Croceicoccus gelatinilyticus]